jgi:hypothetical protein
VIKIAFLFGGIRKALHGSWPMTSAVGSWYNLYKWSSKRAIAKNGVKAGA